MTWGNIKEILFVLLPILGSVLVAYLSYRSNKKSRKEIMTELEVKLKEKDVDTANEIQKMNADLEKQKQLITWNNSQPQTDDYIKKIGLDRYSNVSYLRTLTSHVNTLLSTQNSNKEDLIHLKDMLNQVVLPKRNEELFPYEVPILYDFDLMMNNLENKIKGGEQNANNEK